MGTKKRRKRGSGYAGSTPRMKKMIDSWTRTWAKTSPTLRAGTSSGFRQQRMLAKNAARMGLTVVGSGFRKKRRRRKKGKGLNISGSGMGISGSGYIFSGSGFKRTVGYRRK